MIHDPLDSQRDPFKPPETPVEVSCLHCDQTYPSDRIEWRVQMSADGGRQGFWCCATPGCDGIGFGFDILPTDPNYHDEHGGWVSFDEDEDCENEEDEDCENEEDDELDEEPGGHTCN